MWFEKMSAVGRDVRENKGVNGPRSAVSGDIAKYQPGLIKLLDNSDPKKWKSRVFKYVLKTFSTSFLRLVC